MTVAVRVCNFLGVERLSSDQLFADQAGEFGHVHDFKHVYADITMMIRHELLAKRQQNQPQQLDVTASEG